MIDLNAPILPWIGMANIKLYSSLRDLKEILENEKAKTFSYSRFLLRYEIEGKLYLFFNLINGKLFKITTLNNYTGLLFDKISVGTKEDDLIIIEPSFKYDDFEEVYVSEKGVFIETDPENRTVQWISVFIKELETDDFEDANW